MGEYKIIHGDCLESLRAMESESVDLCVTSPPYYGLRDYGTGYWVGGDSNCPHYRMSKYSPNTKSGHKEMMESGHPVGDAIYKTVCPLCGARRVDKQIGLEETPEEYVQKLTDVFHEVKRVLKKTGTLWVNIGDTYNTTPSGNHENWSEKQQSNPGSHAETHTKKLVQCCKQKDLIGIPWMLAFSLRNDGWYLRQDIIWSKLNPMPEPVKDRCTKSHEHIFLFSKEYTYYFDNDAIKDKSGANKRDVWAVPVSSGNKVHEGEKHYATYSTSLIEPCILAGSKIGDTVLDPFSGTGTTRVASMQYGRKYIGLELSEEYAKMSERRLDGEASQMNIYDFLGGTA